MKKIRENKYPIDKHKKNNNYENEQDKKSIDCTGL